jgi:hypothetical protein
MDWDAWIPPSDRRIEQLGGQTYWTRVISAHECPDFCSPPTSGDVWQCTLFGPLARDVKNTALRLFNMLAADAARLILPRSEAQGKALLSRWLIHLADRPEPIVPDSRWRYLEWPRLGGRLSSPIWVPVTPANPPTCWWAARLPNVFLLSRDAVGQAIDLVASAPAAVVLTPEDKTLLAVLSEAARALHYAQIVREAARLVREKGGTSAGAAIGLMLLSETKIKERVPILEDLGLVSRPLGANGKLTKRKGIGITGKGLSRLGSMS